MKRKIINTILTAVIAAVLLSGLAACEGDYYITETIVTLTYEATAGGRIEGEAIQKFKSGKSGKKVTAVPDADCLFVGWSDGVTSLSRRDKRIEWDHTFTAKFSKQQLELKYSADKGGSITGESEQSIKFGGDASPVTAVPDENYVFVQWSDGVLDAVRNDVSVQDEIDVTAEFQLKKYNVRYSCTEGGHLETSGSDLEQNVTHGQNASQQIRAVPDEGYEFIIWTDGVTTALRYDEHITADMYVIAVFRRKQYTVEYRANHGGVIEGDLIQPLSYGDNTETVTAIPSDGFEFLCWTDGSKSLTRKEENVRTNMELTATFAPVGQKTYKILMVYVTELKADLEMNDGDIFPVDYKMTPTQRKVLEKLSVKFEACLNETLEGKIRFIVDSYFTTQPIGKEHLLQGTDSNLNYSYSVYPPRVPELNGLLDDYRNVITTFSMNDIGSKVHSGGGGALAKYAEVHYETEFQDFTDGELEEYFLDETNHWAYNTWRTGVMDSYLHEFIHSIEMKPEVEDKMKIFWHTAMDKYAEEYGPQYNYVYSEKLFLQHRLVLDGEVAGIPMDYWNSDL